MICNNIILSQPEAGVVVNQSIPDDVSARLNFGSDEIATLQLSDAGALIITFVDGGQLNVTNFEDLIQNGNLLYLEDGTLIDQSVLTGSFKSPTDFSAPVSNDNAIHISSPAENTTQEVTLTEGQKYICNFDPANAATVEIKDGKMILTFNDGSQVIINDYSEVMAGELPAQLTVADGTVIDGNELLTSVTEIGEPTEEVLELASAEEEDLANQVANIEPAAGGDGADITADALNQIAPEAGDGGAGGNSGYGFNSAPTESPFDAPPAVGPLGPTALQYNAPQADPEPLLIQQSQSNAPVDFIPVVPSDIRTLDETNLAVGKLTLSGKITVDYGGDAPGFIVPNDNYVTNGFVANNILSSGGQPVIVTVTPTGYVGKVGATTIFEFTIDSEGNYTFEQCGPLDHSDPNNTNEGINLNFTFRATDSDGDGRNGTVRVVILDDAPVVLSQIAETVDETNFVAGQVTVNGAFYADVGQDVNGEYCGTDKFNATGSVDNNILSSHGVPVVVTFDAGTNTYTGVAGAVTVFTTVLNPVDGTYAFTLFAPLDHADTNNPNDMIELNFGAKIRDFDEDEAEGFFTVKVLDDAPVITGDVESLDETDTFPTAVDGQVAFDFGEDGAGEICVNDNFTATGSLTNGILSSNGVPVVVTVNAAGDTYTGVAGATTVFTFVLNTTNGKYDFTLLAPLDHADGNAANDVITLNFGVKAEDFDGDQTEATVSVRVLDDVPSIEKDTNQVDEDTLLTQPIVVTDKVDFDYGQDGPGEVCGNDDFVAMNVTGGPNITVTSGGVPVVVTFDANTNTYTGVAGATTIFTMVIQSDGNYTYTQTAPIDHPDTNADDEVIWLKFGVKVTDFDGDSDSNYILIDVHDSAPDLDDAQSTIDETDGVGFVTGTVAHSFGGDGAGEFCGTDSFVSSGSKLAGNLTSGGATVNVVFNAGTNTYTGATATKTIFTMVVNADGTYKFDLLGTLDHADPNDPNDIINLDFGVKIVDGDGDTDEGIVRIRVKDDVPTIGDSAGDVDETNLDNGPLVYSDTVDTNFGTELGAVSANGVTSSSVPLTHCGYPVVISNVGNTYSGIANGVTVFTLTIDPVTGQYTYTQHEALDHPDSNDHDDVISINFGIAITSVDSDTDTGTITINVADDGPDAVEDINGAEEDQFITGDVRANDAQSRDGFGDNTVTNVRFNNVDYSVPAVGEREITGDFGVLKIKSDGTYSYQANDFNPNGVDTFTYTLTDKDGDSDTATLAITVTPNGDPVAVNQMIAVDETNLTPGPMIFNGNLNVDFGADGGGMVMATGDFTPRGSLANGQFTSGGVPVNVNLVGNTYTGTAGATTVFTVTINNDGTYQFQLFEAVDHANATDPNDLIALDFGVKVLDADGDTATGTFTIHIHDDAPIAVDDGAFVADDQASVSGNVLTNDDAGEDGLGAVTTPGTFIGTYGNLVLAANGSYTYTRTNNNGGLDTFNYIMRDSDGDTSTAKIIFEVDEFRDDKPIAEDDVFCVVSHERENDTPTIGDKKGLVDETDFATKTILTVTDVVPNDFGNDGAGGISTNGIFSAMYEVNGQPQALKSCGYPVTVTQVSGGYVGTANGETIFSLVIDSQTGLYTYQQFKTLDHPDTTNPDDVIWLKFGVDITDSDGDKDSGQIIIDVKDDGPQANNDWLGSANVQPLVKSAAKLTGNVLAGEAGDHGTAKVGSPNIDYKTSAVKNLSFYNGNGVGNGTDFAGADGGIKVTSFTFDGITKTIPVGGSATISTNDIHDIHGNDLSKSSFSSTFSYYKNANPGRYGNGGFGATTVTVDSNGDVEVNSLGMGTYEFTYTIEDKDGDTSTAEAGFSIVWNASPLVLDLDGDGVELVNAQNGVFFDSEVNGGTLDQTGWAGPDDGFLAIDNNGDGRITDRSELFGDTEGFGDGFDKLASFDTNSDGFITNADARFGDLLIWKDTNTDGVSTVDELFTLAELGISSIAVTAATTDYYINGQWVGLESTFTINGETRTIVDVWFDSISGDDLTNNNADVDGATTQNVITASVLHNDYLSEDGPNHVTSVTFQGTTYNIVTGGSVTIDGLYGTLVMNSDGKFTYTADDNIQTQQEELFTYVLTDKDGDSDPANLKLIVKPTADDKPIAEDDVFCVVSHERENDTPTIGDKKGLVDETDFATKTILTVTDVVPNDFGNDGAGGISTNGIFSAMYEVNGQPQALKSCGYPVTVTQVSGGYVGTANGETIFSLVIDSQTGFYTYQQFKTLDHPDTTNPDDVIWLKFGVDITDSDGDKDSGQIIIDVKDDGPVARNDDLGSSDHGAVYPWVAQFDGNLLSGTGRSFVHSGYNGEWMQWVDADVQADSASADGGLRLTEFTYNGITKTVPDGGSAILQLQLGTVTVVVPNVGTFYQERFMEIEVYSDGSYKIRGTDKGDHEFTYTVIDKDGDTDTTTAIFNIFQNSPLVLDLDGDGIELLNVQQGVFFDSDLDGSTLDQTGWAGPDDGFLAIDNNGDGRITDRAELFGNTQGFSDGFAKLATFDSNSDGFITNTDARFGDLLIWKDANTDGVSTVDELFTLSELGISSIAVGAATNTDYYINGQWISHESTFTINGETRTIVDAWFETISGDDLTNNNADVDGATTQNVITASVLHNDYLSEDGPNHVTSVTFQGTTYNIVTGGSVTIDGLYGTLVMNSDGKFTYTADNNIQTQQEELFTYVLTDKDGDSDPANLKLIVKPTADDTPIVTAPDLKIVDETGGFDTVTGKVNADYGQDGPGEINPNGSFSSSISGLKSCGYPVTVSVVNNTYIGVANGQQVFTLEVLENGNYTFKQLGQLDHPNTSNPNDAIDLNFGVTASDDDGDTANTTITIRVLDDGPIALDDGSFVADDKQQVTGNVLTNDIFGFDGEGALTTPGTYQGNLGVLVLSVNGDYTYTRTSNNGGLDQFTYSIVDKDGDTSTAKILFEVDEFQDDKPIAEDDVFCVVSGGDHTPEITDVDPLRVDETNLNPTVSDADKIEAEFGNDGPGSFESNGDFGFDSTTTTAGNLTSMGIPVVVNVVGNDYVGTANGNEIFRLEVDVTTGDYEFILKGVLDHADVTDPDDAIELSFGVNAKDDDGDIDTGIIKVFVHDDAPVAVGDGVYNLGTTGDKASGNILANDSFGQDGAGKLLSFNGQNIPQGGAINLNTGFGIFTVNSNGGWSFDRTDAYTSTTQGARVWLGGRNRGGHKLWHTPFTVAEKIDGGNITYSYKIIDKDGDISTATITIQATPVTLSSRTWYHWDPLVLDLDGDGIELTNVSNGVYFDMHNDGGTLDQTAWVDSDDGFLVIDKNGDGRITNSGELFGDTNGFTDGFDNLASYDTNNDGKITAADAQFGELLVWKDSNTDGVSTEDELFTLDELGITSIDLNSTSSNLNSNGSPIVLVSTFTINGEERVIGDALFNNISGDDLTNYNADVDGATTQNVITASVLHNDYLSEDGPNHVTSVTFQGTTYNIVTGGSVTIDGLYGTLVMNSDGKFTYTADDNIQTQQEELFTYVLTDKDGDSDPANLKLIVKPNVVDEGEPDIGSVTQVIDETNLGPITVSGTIPHDFGPDGQGEITPNGLYQALFQVGGTPVALTSCGHAVDVQATANGYVGMANGETVFTLTIDSQTGVYSYTQNKPVDHPDASNPDDVIWLKFYVDIADKDGDTDTGTIVIDIHDDGPVAHDDGAFVASAENVKTGNVLVNDDFGADGAGQVTTTGTFNGNLGNLVLNADGSYTYTRTSNNSGIDTFNYTIVDKDGDTASAKIVFEVDDAQDDQPVVVNAYNTVDETGGFDTVSGTVNVNYGGDGPGTVMGSNSFSSTYALKSGGVAVAVTFDTTTGIYTGKAGSATVFTMDVNANGSYTFKQFRALDHANKSNHNDSVDLFFGVKATDNDGDVGTGDIQIRVFDDGPNAVNDGYIGRTNDGASANVLTNDTIGLDSLNGKKVTSFTFAGRTVNVPSGSSASLAVQYQDDGGDGGGVSSFLITMTSSGNLTVSTGGFISANAYISGGAGNQWDITYKITDSDGDTDTATVKFSHTHLYSPLTLDLDGDGVELLGLEEGVRFDIDNDGDVEQVGWVGKDDALLALDRNGDGIINNQSELFGNNDKEFADGFQNLAQYDSNNDGKIDAQDDIYNDLLVWQDGNSDGVNQAGETISLAEAGIASIDLNATENWRTDESGNLISHDSTFTRTDGSTGAIVDAWFSTKEIQDGQYAVDGEADVFLFQSIANEAAEVIGFNAAEGDAIDLSLLIEGESDVNEAIQDFVHLTENNGDTVVSVDVDGANGPQEAVEVARLKDVTGTSLDDLIDNGNIIV